MPCLIVLIGLFSPRLAIILLALFTNDLSRAFDGIVVPFLGSLLDLGSYNGGNRYRRRD